MIKQFLAAGLLSLAAVPAFASGYQVALQGQKQIGMGHTGTALAWDASSIFFNPGALAFVKKNNVIVGASFIDNTVAYRADGTSLYTAETESPISTPFAAYASFKIGDKLAVGLGVTTPFGSSIKWADNWKNASLLQSLSLRAICIQPTVSYKITDQIGIGAGFVYATGGVDLKKQIPVFTDGSGFGQAQLKGPASGYGFNVGLYLEPIKDQLTVGITYRSQVDMKVKGGDATFNTSSAAVASGTFPSGGTNFDATLPLPGSINLGIAYMGIKNLTIAADVNYVMWSAYKELRFDYEKPVAGALFSASKRNYKDANAYRLGLAYQLSEAYAVRGGIYYDQTPVQDGFLTAETPDADRVGYSVGVGINPIANLSIDASLLFINGTERSQTQAQLNAAGVTNAEVPVGTFKTKALVPGLSIAYSF